METIEIEVGMKTAEKWREASLETRERIERKINIELANELLQENKEKLIKSMEILAATAKANGLTEEMLREILNTRDKSSILS